MQTLARWLLLAHFLLQVTARSVGTSKLLAPGNPHVPKSPDKETCSTGQCDCPAQQLMISPANVLPRLHVQGDTFLKSEEKHVAGTEVNIYHFKQPSRLSELELPFKILPLRQVDLTDLEVIEVAPQQALDSWFPGYAWSIIVCLRCEGRHLGWKFTPTGPHGTAFYALIVETVDSEEAEAARVPTEKIFLASIRAIGQPLAAIGLVASALQKAGA